SHACNFSRHAGFHNCAGRRSAKWDTPRDRRQHLQYRCTPQGGSPPEPPTFFGAADSRCIDVSRTVFTRLKLFGRWRVNLAERHVMHPPKKLTQIPQGLKPPVFGRHMSELKLRPPKRPFLCQLLERQP